MRLLLCSLILAGALCSVYPAAALEKAPASVTVDLKDRAFRDAVVEVFKDRGDGPGRPECFGHPQNR